MARLLSRIGGGAARHRFVVGAVWLLVLVAAGVGAGTLSGKTVNTFSIPGQESTTALHLITERFGSGASGATAQVVLEAPDGQKITDPGPAGEVAGLVQRLGGLAGVASATDPLDPRRPAVSADQRVSFSTVTYPVQPSE